MVLDFINEYFIGVIWDLAVDVNSLTAQMVSHQYMLVFGLLFIAIAFAISFFMQKKFDVPGNWKRSGLLFIFCSPLFILTYLCDNDYWYRIGTFMSFLAFFSVVIAFLTTVWYFIIKVSELKSKWTLLLSLLSYIIVILSISLSMAHLSAIIGVIVVFGVIISIFGSMYDKKNRYW